MARGSETITIRPAQQTDRWGDPMGDLPPAVTVEGCIIYPQSTREDNGAGGFVVLETLGVYVPPGSDTPAPADTVEARGETWNVRGAVGAYINKRGADKGYLFTLQRTGT